MKWVESTSNLLFLGRTCVRACCRGLRGRLLGARVAVMPLLIEEDVDMAGRKRKFVEFHDGHVVIALKIRVSIVFETERNDKLEFGQEVCIYCLYELETDCTGHHRSVLS
jgi:hypothetical protein